MTWIEYQDEAAEFFRALGLTAQTNARAQGVRTTHDIDVLVTSNHAGFAVTWVVECKQWNSRVSKLHVLALREIVSDLGADRGILLSESGFQSGALEAANLTNVKITSLAAARAKSEHDINAMRLRDLYDRVEECKAKYWSIPKSKRIASGLRPNVFESRYSGASVISSAEEILRKAMRGKYPFDADELASITLDSVPATFDSSAQVIAVIMPMVDELEGRLLRATQD